MLSFSACVGFKMDSNTEEVKPVLKPAKKKQAGKSTFYT
jgi:hypothetical protein